MTIERVSGAGVMGWRITDMVDGRYYSRLFIGYTKAGAIRKFIAML